MSEPEERWKVTEKEIVSAVLARLDISEEIVADTQEFGEPGFDLRGRISGLIEETAAEILAAADIREAGPLLPLSGSLRREGCRLLLGLPGDLLRLIYIRIEGWPYGLAEGDIMPGRSETVGLRRLWEHRGELGHRRHPGVAESFSQSGRVLEIFGASEGASVAEGSYVARPYLNGGEMAFPRSMLGRLAEAISSRIKQH